MPRSRGRSKLSGSQKPTFQYVPGVVHLTLPLQEKSQGVPRVWLMEQVTVHLSSTYCLLWVLEISKANLQFNYYMYHKEGMGDDGEPRVMLQ